MNDYVINGGVLEKYEGSASTVEIPPGVVEIGTNAFRDNSLIVNVIIPNGVKQIQACAFRVCSSLKTVSFPEGLETIGAAAFEYCKLLQTVLIPESVRLIGSSAFAGCSKLERVVLPSNVKTDSLYSVRPSDGIFNMCDSLKTAGPINSGCDIEFGWTDEIPDVVFLGLYLTKATIPDSVKSIGPLAFYRNISYIYDEKHGYQRAEKDLQITLPKTCKLGRRALPEGTQIIFSNSINSKDKLDASILDYVDKKFVKRLSDEEIAWIIMYQSKKWRTTILSFMSNDQQVINVLKCCCDILKDTKKITKSIGDAVIDLHSKIKDRSLSHSSAEELFEFLKGKQ